MAAETVSAMAPENASSRLLLDMCFLLSIADPCR
jgi:hypothetical protein